MQIGGVLHILMAAFHLSFPLLFRWGEDLSAVSSANRAIVYTLHLAVVLVLLFFAFASLVTWRELTTTRLGRSLVLCISLVWLLRATTEIVYFHIGVDGAWWRVLLFLALAGLYLVPFVMRVQRKGQNGLPRLAP